ncbi:MAG: DNA mismatch repair protein MutS [Pseudomonadota bacterium]
MLKQYLKIKSEHEDAILMFRLGDFYEMFFDDAKLAAEILSITLTARNKNDANPVPLCGVPYHSVDSYIAKLLNAGKRVAICDQTEDPAQAKGIVKREVTRVLTPGVITDGAILSAPHSNFIASLYSPPPSLPHQGGGARSVGLSWADVSTGVFRCAQFETLSEAVSEIARIGAKELILPKSISKDERKGIIEGSSGLLITDLDERYYNIDVLRSLDGASQAIETNPLSAKAAAAIYAYVSEKQCGSPIQIERLESVSKSQTMQLDQATIRNLELTRNLNDFSKRNTLLQLLDRTKTAMGCRLMEEWLLYPLTSKPEIEKRLDAVEAFFSSMQTLTQATTLLKSLSDLERISSRLLIGNATPRDLGSLSDSLEIIPKFKELLATQNGWLKELGEELVPLEALKNEISAKVVEEPPYLISHGGVIRDGADSLLDELRSLSRGGRDRIASLEEVEKKRSGISSLKVRYNKVFGYYIEVTNAHKDKVPVDYIRKQTLVNAERFITPELKEWEEKVLGAQEKIKAREEELFFELRATCAKHSADLKKNAIILAKLDVLSALVQVAIERNYVKPVITDGDLIKIKDGRHPIVEANKSLERFVPNDTLLDDQKNRLLLITGPNMAGKSTLMRQVALIVLMAQMGSFVPAKACEIGLTDRIFTRIGASDALSRGESTFMVEMSEASQILKQATSKSLIIIDEIGRGTSTFDGLSIAWAVAEHINNTIKARTLFATHYHELTELAVNHPGVVNYNIAIKEWNNEIIFLRKFIPGATPHSYGIQVAALAGLPKSVIDRSKEVLKNLEEGEFDDTGRPRIGHGTSVENAIDQLSLFTKATPHPVVEKLKKIELDITSPIEALNLLHLWKKEV